MRCMSSGHSPPASPKASSSCFHQTLCRPPSEIQHAWENSNDTGCDMGSIAVFLLIPKNSEYPARMGEQLQYGQRQWQHRCVSTHLVRWLSRVPHCLVLFSRTSDRKGTRDHQVAQMASRSDSPLHSIQRQVMGSNLSAKQTSNLRLGSEFSAWYRKAPTKSKVLAPRRKSQWLRGA